MRVRAHFLGFMGFLATTMLACEPAPSSEWLLLAEDSEGKPTFINVESIRRMDGGMAVYRRAVGEPLAADRVDFVQGLDCTNLRWAFLTLDESALDSIAGLSHVPEGWDLLALNPANRVLLDTVCEGISPTRWIRVLKKNPEGPGDLKDVWVDRETISGPSRDTVWTELEDLGYSEEILRSWSRWHDASPDSGYYLIQADVACDKGVLRYLENSRYSKDGEMTRETEATDLWFPMFELSFEEQVFDVVCEMRDFFKSELSQPDLTPETSPEGG